MALSRVLLGNHIEFLDRRNVDLLYGAKEVRGVNNLKKMIRTKADLTTRDLSKFKVVAPGEFFFNHRTSRNGDKFSVTFNYDSATHIVTDDYVVFRVLDDGVINPIWLYLYLCRTEFDRYVIQHSWGSATELFNWEDFCEIEINLPDIETQRKYAAIYSAMLENQRCYERGLDDLKLACDAYIDQLMRDYPLEQIGPYLFDSDERNTEDLLLESVRGISTDKLFISTKANMDGVSLDKYKIVRPSEFAYVADTSRRGDKISLALNEANEPYLVSSISIVFKTNNAFLNPYYLMLFFSRDEFDRYARYNSWGSARETFNWDDMREVRIPIPSIEVQDSVADVFKSYRTRFDINERLKDQLKDLCPILIKGSVEESLK